MTTRPDAATVSRPRPSCRFCGRKGRGYKREPESYVAWHEWAEKMSRTHRQEACPNCGRFTVWTKT